HLGQIFQQEGYAVKNTRWLRLRRGGLGARLVESRIDHTIQLGGDAFDAFDCCVNQFARRGLTRSDEIGLRGRVDPGEFVAVERCSHGANPTATKVSRPSQVEPPCSIAPGIRLRVTLTPAKHTESSGCHSSACK